MDDEPEPIAAELVERPPLLGIPPGVGPDCRALALTLRGLFAALDVSVRRYAVRVPMDAGALSRYLNGTRVAPAELVDRLLRDVDEKAGPRTAEFAAAVRQAQRRALAETSPTQAALQVLRDELAQADLRHRQSELREQALAGALQTRQRDLADLIGRHRELQIGVESERVEYSAELDVIAARERLLQGERDDLVNLVRELQDALSDARRRTLEAERRCEELEHQLVCCV